MKPTTTGDVLELMESYIAAAALGAALELGLFWLLSEQPQDAAGVGEALGILEKRCEPWLELMCSMGLLERVSEAYAPSSTARATILEAYSRETWALLAQEAREQLPAFQDLALRIRDPDSGGQPGGPTPHKYVARMEDEPQRARRFARMLYEIHQPLADELSTSLDMTGVKRLMDLGGGSGVVSLALLRQHPQLTATVVDIANVCEAGREIAAEESMQERLTYHAADFLQDELPAGFDVVLECDVGVYGETLFRRLRTALNPGGRVLIVDWLARAGRIAEPSLLHRAFLASLGIGDWTTHTVGEIQTMLTRAGFQVEPESTLPSGWTVIEASKPKASGGRHMS